MVLLFSCYVLIGFGMSWYGLEMVLIGFMLSEAPSEGLGSIYLNINRIGIDSGLYGLFGCWFLGCGIYLSRCGTSILCCGIARRCRIGIYGRFDYSIDGVGRCFAMGYNEVFRLFDNVCESRGIACSGITCRRIVRSR